MNLSVRISMATCSVLVLLLLSSNSNKPVPAGTDPSLPGKMDWFADAKLGIFIHWGVYSTGNTTESWAFFNKEVSHNDYMAQLDSFTAAGYDPAYWAGLIRASGARYSVITSKHHDGVALWDTRMNDLSTTNKTPAARDVLTPFVEELRRNDLKVGLYFSLIDWTYPDYPGFMTDSAKYKIKEEPERWERFLQFCHGQIDELMDAFMPDLMWFDGDWEHSADEWRAPEIRSNILGKSPGTIINGRLAGYGDYATPEQNFPITRPTTDLWELCMTMNNSWGYLKRDGNYKTPYEIITIFADVIGMGGNLLLDIGPKADGTIPPEQVSILTELGKWTSKHGDAIFGTVAGLPQGHYYGPSTLAKDSLSLFLFLPGSVSGDIVVKGLDNQIKSITVVGEGSSLDHKIVGKISWSNVPGLVYIKVPQDVQDTYITVLRLGLDKPLKLYRGQGGF